ncbi:virulence factor TspB C-terminal domain-related protein [Methylobacter sp. Wu1]|uniref:virulence factor TspB C-terminal domain-related protein n=1 Tax=Methylobacter sp. Wu1 TaxID=3119359 RepID=UPI002F92B07C
MDYLFRLIALLLLFFSVSVFAGDHWFENDGAAYSACVSGGNECSQTQIVNNAAWTQCYQNQATKRTQRSFNSQTSSYQATGEYYYYCAYLQACQSGQVRDESTGQCITPVPQCDSSKNETYRSDLGACGCAVGELRNSGGVCMVPVCNEPLLVNESSDGESFSCVADCQWPETDNGFGSCEVKECTSTQYRDVSTGNCEDTPQCAASETWSPSQSQCILNQLNCPGHSHANYANDACLPDAPIACPEGQHDDGTYTCVADDAKGCAAGTQRGFIEGQLQCIPKHNIDLEQKESDDKQKAANDAAAAAKAAADAAKIAADAAAANPNDPALQQAAQAAAAAAADAAAKAAQTAHDAAMRETSDATAKTLDDINQKVEEFTDPEPVNDLIKKEEGKKLPNTEVPVTNTPIAGFSGGGSCLADRTLSVMGNSYTLSMAPVCDFASHIRPVILSIAGVLSVAIIATVI